MEKFTIANETAFRYLDTEKGEQCVVLIHGYLESIESWDTLIKPLSEKYRVITLDVPGHGISEVKGEVHTTDFVADTIAALCAKIGVSKAVFIGHSMGGYMALAVARRYPELVGGLVLLHSSPDGDTDEKKHNREREIELILSGKKEMLATVNPAKGFAKANKKRFEDAIIDIAQQVMLTEDEGIVALLRGMMTRGDSNEVFHALGSKAMFVFGGDDTFMPRDYCTTLVERHSEAHVFWAETSGHNSHIEQTQETLEALTNFIDCLA